MLNINITSIVCIVFVLLLTSAFPISSKPIDPATIPDSEYVTIQNGVLTVGGERQRFWSATDKTYARFSGFAPGDTEDERAEKIRIAYASTDRILDHLEQAGFNSVRLWAGFHKEMTYTKGDGSEPDLTNYFIHQLKERGFRVWTAGLNRLSGVVPSDVDVITDPDTREAWMSAVAEGIRNDPKKRKRVGHHPYEGWALDKNPAVFWDHRLEAMVIERMSEVANHYNQYTGLRWADDPVFAVWELSNEQWWIVRMLNGKWQTLPDFFQQSLFDQWNAFLLNKYESQKSIEEAWGKLLPGEQLGDGSILFAPMAKSPQKDVSINDSNPNAAQALTALSDAYLSEGFPDARASDVLEFLTQMMIGHKQRLAAAIKPLGKSLSLSPMIFDTGIGYQIQSLYLHQHADAVAFNAYVNGWGKPHDELVERESNALNPVDLMRLELETVQLSTNDGPWINWLMKPPGIAGGVPWLEHNRIEGKPFLCYETQIQQPAKYRADFPLRIAALASIQDWCWVNWHYFGDNTMYTAASDERPFEKALDVTVGGHSQGYHFTYDEVQQSLMRGAAYVFINHAWNPAVSPTVFTYGKNDLYGPGSMNYGNSYGIRGMDMFPTVYEHGVRIRINPSVSDGTVTGPVVKASERSSHNPYKPTEQILFDHKQGYMKAVSPKAVAYAGRNYAQAEISLGNSLLIKDLQVINPPHIFDPVDTSKPYFAVALYSIDGLDLSDSNHAGLSIASTSFNSEYKIGPLTTRNISGKTGSFPVLVARPDARIYVRDFAGGKYFMYDFNGDVIASDIIESDGLIKLGSSQPVWHIELIKTHNQ